MRQRHVLAVLTALLLPCGGLADVWQDPVSKVNYEYTPGQSEAIVKKGTSQESGGSPDVSGDIIIQSSFTVDGVTYAVTNIGDMAFAQCSKLTSVHIPNSVKRIGNGAFYECEKLQSINIPESVTNLGAIAFVRCGLKTIEIPGSVTRLYNQTFLQCKKLETVSIGEGVTVIEGIEGRENADGGVFSWCWSLKTVSLPESLKEIGPDTFGWCYFLSEIELPKNIEKIGSNAFYGTGCRMENFTIHSYIDNPFVVNGVFDENPEETTLYIPIGTKSKYQATEGWKEFKNIVEMVNLDPMAGETTVNTENLDGQDLTDNVVDDVYYNVGDGSYDATEGCVVISQATNMGNITYAEPGTDDVKENFTGMILKVAKGKGTVKVKAKTTGNVQLVVQVGNGIPMLATVSEQGDAMVGYDVQEDSYVYIYAILNGSASRVTRAESDSELRIYDVAVSQFDTTPKLPGDINADKKLDIEDVTTLVDMILKQ